MSTGPRIPLDVATRVAEVIRNDVIGGQFKTALIVGSIRRKKETVGDVEYTFPWEPKENDALYTRLAELAHLGEPPLFGERGHKMIDPIEGVKPGFKAARFYVQVQTPTGVVVAPAAIYRHEPHNKGMIEIIRTGPREFGMAVLHRWRSVFKVTREVWDARDQGTVVDQWGKVVPVGTEEEVFTKLGIAFEPPERREEAAARYWAVCRGDD